MRHNGFRHWRRSSSQRHWKLLSYTKSSWSWPVCCRRGQGRPDTQRSTWQSGVIADLTRVRPFLVITSSYSDYQALHATNHPLPRGDSDAAIAAGFRAMWSSLVGLGSRVAVLADTPAAGFDVPDCVSANPGHLTNCAFNRSATQMVDPQRLALKTPEPGVTLVDLDDAVCPTALCAPVIGGVLVYRDINHLTKTYVLTLAPRLSAALPTG